jgi:NAD-dependent dihydropyrimidine dehydrogenase PreA subunit
MKTRKIVKIDEDRCNGCGLCVPSCAEGAIQIIDGKARLIADNLCDGIGNCLGECPMDAITIEERPADDFDETAVEAHLKTQHADTPGPSAAGGCPGMKFKQFGPRNDTAGCDCAPAPAAGAGEATGAQSALTHWPVQLGLLSPNAPMWQDTDVLLAADCCAQAMADFHSRLLTGRKLAIACPKLDDSKAQLDKLTEIFTNNDIHSLTVARMEVPCCGLDQIARLARERSGKTFPITIVTVGLRGEVLLEADA